MSASVVAMRVSPVSDRHAAELALASTLSVVRLGLDLLADPDLSLGRRERKRLMTLLAAAGAQAGQGARQLLVRPAVESAA
jgi:hypothetical protein